MTERLTKSFNDDAEVVRVSKVITPLPVPKTNNNNSNRSRNRENERAVARPLAWVRLEQDEDENAATTNDVTVHNPIDRT